MTPSSDPDAGIETALRRVLEGQGAAFEAVIRRFERPLRAWLAGQAPPGVDVDEIAQRAFVAAYTRLADYRLGTDFSAWLFTIARFQLRTETTRLRRVADYHSRYAPDLLKRELERHGTETPRLAEDRLESLQACLEQLGDPVRKYLRWRYEDELPLEEMAQRSGRSLSAVKKQLWVLRRRLQECVESRLAAEGGS